MSRASFRLFVLHAVFFLSGAAGLGYQVAWLKIFATGLGHEMPATLAVVCAFMGGMGLGAWALDKPIARSRSPGLWYSGLEFVIGVWALLSTFLLPWVNQAALHAIGLDPSAWRHWTVAFALPFLAILPATAAMGATLPAMERFVCPLAADGRCVGAIYAANTLGAATGALLSAFLILPALGLTGSVRCFALLNELCGAVVFLLARTSLAPATHPPISASSEQRYNAKPHADSRVQTSPSLNRRRQLKASPSTAPGMSATRLRLTLVVTGLLGIGYETMGIRVLSQVLENTVYTFAGVLAVFLVGSAVGAALYQRWFRQFTPHLVRLDLLGGVSFTCLLGVVTLGHAQPIYEACRHMLGDTPAGVSAAEIIIAALVFGLPTLFMGAIFSHFVQEARRPDGGVGSAAALNTFGAALAPALFGVGLLPFIGSKWALIALALGYVALLPEWPAWRWRYLALPTALLFAWPADLRAVRLPANGTLAVYRDGVMGSVAVIEDADHQKTLRVDNRFQMGGTAAAEAEYRHAHIPLLLHPAPKRALFLGLGTGITFGAASLHPGLVSDGVELVPEVIQVFPQFEPYNFSPNSQPALKVHVADARRFIQVATNQYDLIVADLFHPARDGAGSLYTVEHFRAARERLAPGGLFCQWLPLHQLDEPMLQVIIRTFLQVFPEAQAYLLRFNVDAPVVGLVGSLEWPHFQAHWIESRLEGSPLSDPMKKLALADSIRFFGNLVAGPAQLHEFAGPGPPNTDDRPTVTFGAPRFAYQKQALSYGRLMSLLAHPIQNLAEVLKLGVSPEAVQFSRQLADYMAARNVFLHGLVAETEGQSEHSVDAFVESARLSNDFTPGYARCLTIASLEAKENPDKARTLLQRLAEAQPSRPVAAEMLRRLTRE